MRPLTTVVILAVLAMGALGPSSAQASETASEAVVITAVSLPVMANPDLEVPSLVVPPDLLQFVEEQYVYDLAVEVNTAAAEYGLPVRLCWEVIRKESTFHHYLPNGKIKRGDAGEYGICQILLDGMAIKKRHNVLDRAGNIRCMCELLRYALVEREYSLERALGWYNTGKAITNDYARSVARAYRAWEKQDGGTPL